jgi:hypothetical protein
VKATRERNFLLLGTVNTLQILWVLIIFITSNDILVLRNIQCANGNRAQAIGHIRGDIINEFRAVAL